MYSVIQIYKDHKDYLIRLFEGEENLKEFLEKIKIQGSTGSSYENLYNLIKPWETKWKTKNEFLGWWEKEIVEKAMEDIKQQTKEKAERLKEDFYSSSTIPFRAWKNRHDRGKGGSLSRM